MHKWFGPRKLGTNKFWKKCLKMSFWRVSISAFSERSVNLGEVHSSAISRDPQTSFVIICSTGVLKTMGERGTKSYIVEWGWDFGTGVYNVNAKTILKFRTKLRFKISNQTQN